MSNEQTDSVNVRAWVRLGVAVVAALFLLIFILRNAGTVEIDFLFGSVETRLVWALLLSALLGLVIGLALPRLRRKSD